MHRINWSTHSSWIFVRKQIDMDCAKCSPTFFAMKKEELFFNNLSFRTPIVIHCNHRLQIAQPSKSPDKNCNMIGANEPWLGIVSEPGRTSGGVTCWRRCGFTIWSVMFWIGALTSSSMGTSGNPPAPAFPPGGSVIMICTRRAGKLERARYLLYRSQIL